MILKLQIYPDCNAEKPIAEEEIALGSGFTQEEVINELAKMYRYLDFKKNITFYKNAGGKTDQKD